MRPVRIDDGLWEVRQPLRRMGLLAMDHRMTVIALGSGRIALHSPVAIDDALGAELAALGQVELVLLPSLMHDLYLADCFARYPDARFLAAAGLTRKYPDLPFTAPLSAGALASESADLEVVRIAGMPRVEECVLFHRPTRTLILADLIFNLRHCPNPLGRLLLRLLGIWNQAGPSRLFRSLVRDRAAFVASLERVLEWEVDRIVVGHGEIVERDGRETLRRGFASWLRRSAGSAR